jgi:hypothetical protein
MTTKEETQLVKPSTVLSEEVAITSDTMRPLRDGPLLAQQ